MTHISLIRPSRRSVLAGGGALVVSSFALPEAIGRAVAQGAAKPPLLPTELDSFIAVGADGTVTAFFGKMDVGHGLTTAVAQIVADELDVRFERVKVVMADTATTVDQGGASGSTGIQEVENLCAMPLPKRVASLSPRLLRSCVFRRTRLSCATESFSRRPVAAR
jgi:hypothetical protein